MQKENSSIINQFTAMGGILTILKYILLGYIAKYMLLEHDISIDSTFLGMGILFSITSIVGDRFNPYKRLERIEYFINKYK